MEPNIFSWILWPKKKHFLNVQLIQILLIKWISVSKRINYKLCFISSILVWIDVILLFYFNLIKKGVLRPAAFFTRKYTLLWVYISSHSQLCGSHNWWVPPAVSVRKYTPITGCIFPFFADMMKSQPIGMGRLKKILKGVSIKMPWCTQYPINFQTPKKGKF